MAKSYLIAPFTSGLTKNKKPFLIMEDAFATLNDAYVWRDRLRKRFGYALSGATVSESRLRINIGTTDGAGNLGATIVPGSQWNVGQTFSIGTTIFTVTNGTPGPQAMLTTGAATGTFDTATGSVVITGNAENPTTAVYYYPTDPVMGILTRETGTINQEDTIAFDTQFSYLRIGGAWSRLGTAVWTGSNSQFFWGTNYRGPSPYDNYFYVVNYNSADNIKYYDGTTWTNLRPQLDSGATRYLDSARVLIGYKDRLIALNTKETDGGSQTFGSRCRFSQNGNPTAATTSWLDNTRGRGGYIDAPTTQQIITADIIKDRLIVYFERSTWELVYTGYLDSPFKWQQINNELGAESTFSMIGFDDAILGVGNVGVHSCNGINVRRIDQSIPDEVFAIHNDGNGPERVYGIRDYSMELVYWAFPDYEGSPTFPNRVLVYNYRNNTWAIFRDSFTCFGQYQGDAQLTWANVGQKYASWEEWNAPWDSSRSQTAFPKILAGNQQGFTLVVDPDDSSNDRSLVITNIDAATSQLTVINHNLKEGDYIRIEDTNGVTLSDGVTTYNNTISSVQVFDSNTIVVDVPFLGTYTGGGVLRRISQIDIQTKQFNPGTPIGQQSRFPYIDFLMATTAVGEFTITTLLDGYSTGEVETQAPSGVLLGSSSVSTSSPTITPDDKSDYIWQRYYSQSSGQMIQFNFTFSDSQMRDYAIMTSDWVMNAMLIYVEAQGRLINV